MASPRWPSKVQNIIQIILLTPHKTKIQYWRINQIGHPSNLHRVKSRVNENITIQCIEGIISCLPLTRLLPRYEPLKHEAIRNFNRWNWILVNELFDQNTQKYFMGI